MRKFLLCAVLLFIPTTVFAQNPCQASETEVKVDPTAIYTTLPRFNDADFDGLTRFVYEGAGTTPIDTRQVTKAQLTLVEGTTDCYRETYAPTGTFYKRDDTTQYFVTTRIDGLRGTSSPAGPRSNPFVLSRPVVPFTAPENRVGSN